jgi:hypothetical protein
MDYVIDCRNNQTLKKRVCAENFGIQMQIDVIKMIPFNDTFILFTCRKSSSECEMYFLSPLNSFFDFVHSPFQ